MKDDEIVKMFRERNEAALRAAENKFGSYCKRIA